MEKKLTVGLLVGGILDQLTIAVAKGAMRVAEQKGINLIIIPGKYIERDLADKKGIVFEYQYNALFSCINKNNIDALLISADSIGCFTTKENIKRFVQRYNDIPCILIASKIDGYISVSYDNYKGIEDGLEYLINNLKCTKIGMIGGPDDNTDTQERKKTFIEVLGKNGISFNEDNYISGQLARKFNNIYSKFLDKNEDVEAIFCANDDIAVGLYDELMRRKKIPGKDVYVFGYDNLPCSAKMKPTLSSVDAEATELGENAVRLIVKMLNNENVSSVVLPTRFIKRDSFGYELNECCDSDLHKLTAYFNEIFYRYIYETDKEQVKIVKKHFGNCIEALYKLSSAKYEDKSLKLEALDSFDVFLEHDILQYADTEKFQECLNQIIYMFKKQQNDITANNEFYSVITKIYNKIISEMERRSVWLQDEQENKNYGIKLFASDIMEFEKGNDQSYMTLLEHLDWLDIYNAYVYIFDEPKMNLPYEEIILPKELYLKAILKNGVAQSVPLLYQKKGLDEIFNNEFIEKLGTYMVLLPLFSNEMLYGLVLCDMTEKIFEHGEFLVNQMGSAVKMLHLLKMNAKVQMQLEESLTALKENNIALNTLSKSDALTGIWNRRGFYDEAEKMLIKNREAKKQTLVAYVDMNNLKIINDKFGHDNGDFSIKLISELLTEIVSDKGVAGRIGGDEFAVILSYENLDNGEGFKKAVEAKFEEFNITSDKPYLVKVSVGAYILDADNDMKLNEAMTFADEKLYEEKKNRSKNVIK